MGKGLGHGFIGGVSAAATVAVVVNPGGRIAASVGKASFSIAAKQFGIGVTESTIDQVIDSQDETDISLTQSLVGGALNAIRLPFFNLKPGTFFSSKRIFTKNTGKILGEFGLSSILSQNLEKPLTNGANYIGNNIFYNYRNSCSYYQYVTPSGMIYPTTNPDFTPSQDGQGGGGGGNQFAGGCRSHGNAQCPKN